MKKNLPFLMMLGLALLSSCASYQISTISTQNENQNTDPFTFENDSVKIVYDFKGYNAPLTVSIQNKLNQPLYVDWNKSLLVFDNNSISLSGANIQIQGRINGSSENYGSTTYSNQNANLSASKPLNVDYLLPKATIKRQTIYVANEMMKQAKGKSGYSYINRTDGSGVTKVATETFNPDNSPLKFKSYITLFTEVDGKPAAKSMMCEKSFYVSDIKNVASKPKNFTYYTEANKNVFYTSKITKFGKMGFATGEAVINGVSQGISESLTNKNKASNNQ
ncbi:MAG: hypothetical protein IE931_14375 [Sphingobacteriales bacterium]|nr:hypothetical protein [Sphingobacteriales bacterium]